MMIFDLRLKFALEFLRLNCAFGFEAEPAPGLIHMNLQHAVFELELVASPPAPVVKPPDGEETPKAANDDDCAWPLLPFPEDWCASN
jgi:hypothetical protein